MREKTIPHLTAILIIIKVGSFFKLSIYSFPLSPLYFLKEMKKGEVKIYRKTQRWLRCLRHDQTCTRFWRS